MQIPMSLFSAAFTVPYIPHTCIAASSSEQHPEEATTTTTTTTPLLANDTLNYEYVDVCVCVCVCVCELRIWDKQDHAVMSHKY